MSVFLHAKIRINTHYIVVPFICQHKIWGLKQVSEELNSCNNFVIHARKTPPRADENRVYYTRFAARLQARRGGKAAAKSYGYVAKINITCLRKRLKLAGILRKKAGKCLKLDDNWHAGKGRVSAAKRDVGAMRAGSDANFGRTTIFASDFLAAHFAAANPLAQMARMRYNKVPPGFCA